jgi:hypothetical protein
MNKIIHTSVKKVSLVILTIFIFLSPLIGSVYAHSPQDMVLAYDSVNQKLNVTITHNVVAPNDHYIETVEIYKNDVLIHIENYTSQPSLSTFTYSYDIQAQPGDTIRVTAICSISGSITETITIGEPTTDEITVTITPQISSIDENEVQDFVVTTAFNGQPLDDVTLDIDVKLGAASPYQRIATGQYSFTYTAADVNKALDETIDIRAEKEGYPDGRTKMGFTINDIEDTQGDCDPTLNGIIDPDEYDHIASFGGGEFRLHWKVQNDTILMAMEGKTTGWVAIGFDPENRMEGADMIFGWVTGSGGISAVDAYATGPTGPHPKDTDQGGTSDILCFGGSESGGTTIIEFKRLLFTGDSKDKTIPTAGELTIIWAIGPDDDFNSEHSQRGAGKIDFGAGTFSEIEIPSFWIIHASFMIMGLILMFTGMIIAKFYKDTRWWFKRHKIVAPIGSAFSVIGLIFGFIMVSMSSGEHFQIPHAIVGLIAVIFAIITPILGKAQFKIKKNKPKIRAAHRWSGRITITLMLLNIIFGLSVVGII